MGGGGRLWLRVAVLFAVVAAGCGLGCAGAKPPALNVADVADCWVFDYHPTGSPGAVVAAYNASTPADFNSETTPDLEATLKLSDGSTVCLMFSSIFPAGDVLVLMSKNQEAAGDTYKIRAPGLLEAVRALAGGKAD